MMAGLLLLQHLIQLAPLLTQTPLLLLLHLAVQQTLLQGQLHLTPPQQAPLVPPSESLHHQHQLAGLLPLLL
jgi:hypothetical protein